ncbi:MAG: amylo-alpha-1,6-glucosidase [Acidobacteria bacterium]|nr:amylo-alpha-1,6-glucosidase [Acidobacteriota bacterium]
MKILTLSLFCVLSMNIVAAQSLPPKFDLLKSGLELERRTQAGSFYDVVGHRAAALGYEHGRMEAWVYPLKVLDDFKLAFKIEGYPLEFDGADILTGINVRPEATIFTYSHAAFTVREIIFAPIDEPGIIILLDVESRLPISVIGTFRPRLSLMWPAGLMTGDVDLDKNEKIYYLVEESRRFTGLIGSPVLADLSLMPYQEEPRDLPVRFTIDQPGDSLRRHFIPIVITGSVDGRAKARQNYQSLLGNVKKFYDQTVAHYRRLNEETLAITTPDQQLNRAFAWAKVGIDKGLATNPLLGSGLIAGFRTSGNSERPGFAWYFGRDSLWTSFAVNSYGDFAVTRAALEFLRKVQREDGKIPHEVSQSASFVPWFTDYPYPWASSDATPLYIIACADYLRTSGDREFIKAAWDSILKAYRFAAATDTDGNSLIENTNAGHGWVEGGRLYPPHEEIYLQGLWIEALMALAEMASIVETDEKLPEELKSEAEQARRALERTYWVGTKRIYAFATNRPRSEQPDHERGEKNPAVKSRMEALRKSTLIDEVTVLPAVPMWWRLLDEEQADQMLDRIGGAEISSDWGARILSNQSLVYDPLSYHYGSVWPLFTGWASMAAYNYNRPHIGYDYLMANALLTYDNALGYVTELLSGDFNQSFGRSSHHQIWSSAMVITPLVRGLFGLEPNQYQLGVTFAPQLPPGWDKVELRNIRLGMATWDLALDVSHQFGRLQGYSTMRLSAKKKAAPGPDAAAIKLNFKPSFPPDAKIRRVKLNGREIKFHLFRFARTQVCHLNNIEGDNPVVEIEYSPGTEVIIERKAARTGDSSRFLKLLGTKVDGDLFNIDVEGRSGELYYLRVRSHRTILRAINAKLEPDAAGEVRIAFRIPGSRGSGYVRQTIRLQLGL